MPTVNFLIARVSHINRNKALCTLCSREGERAVCPLFPAVSAKGAAPLIVRTKSYHTACDAFECVSDELPGFEEICENAIC